jgi:hypothetical protein
MLKKILLLFLLLFTSISFYAQNDLYVLEIKNGQDLGPIQTTTNLDGTLTFSMANTSFAESINTNTIFEFNEMFPTAITPRLKRVYLLLVSPNFPVQTILDRFEVENLFLMDPNENLLAEQAIFVLPNDYEDPILGGRNTALDIIRAPLAWTITTGDPSIVTGVNDAAASLVHPDLDGQILYTILDDINPLEDHGVNVSGLISAKTNNDSHVASIAYGSKLVFAHSFGGSTTLIPALLALSQEPNVRVINCSWSVAENHVLKSLLDDVVNEVVEQNGVVIAAAAGNDPTTEYRYPASYDNTISVTSSGHKFPIDFDHNILDADGDEIQFRSWKDVFPHKPHISGNTASHNYNDKVDVTAPSGFTPVITNDFVNFPNGLDWTFTTSGATPWVTGVANLVISVNPSLTPAEVRTIIRNTADDIYHIPFNQQYLGLIGTGRVNAYRAVLQAECMVNPSGNIDLAMQNSPLDLLIEPDNVTEKPWFSDDIWVRNQNDGSITDEHQNPEYDPNNPNYAYVRVTNNSCVPSSGNDIMKLYWAKANTALSWPNHWNGTLFMTDPSTGEDILMGDEVGSLTIPSLEVGESKVLEFQWSVPNPQDYVNFNTNPWHFCLLARVESNDDPMTFIEGDFITANVRNNNNIAWKNMTVIEIVPDLPTLVSAAVAVGNPYDVAHNFNLELVAEGGEPGKAIYDEAEVSVILDDVIYGAWDDGGSTLSNIKATSQVNKFIVEDDGALIENLQFSANEIGTVTVSFNFLVDEMTEKRKYVYHLIQRDAVTNEVIGGETFEVRKQPRDSFSADAGNDEEIDVNDSVTISAEDINEAATYNWYDPEGNLIHTGTDLTVTPDITTTYQLEIVTDVDGFKDYDEVQVTVNPYKIESLVPNPTSSNVTVNYLASGSVSAYLMIVNTNTGSSDNHILDPTANFISIDASSFATGLYNVILICDGEVQNSETLVKQ